MKLISKLTTLCAVSALIFTGCGSEEQTTTQADNVVKPATLLSESVILKEKPAGAITITEARKLVEPGKEITIFGTVGGARSPFVGTRASMILADHTAMKACGAEACTSCPYPWDFCCEPKESLAKSILTVQFIDSEGMVLKQGLEGFGGIKKNGILTVKGKFAENATDQLVIINAEKIFVDK